MLDVLARAPEYQDKLRFVVEDVGIYAWQNARAAMSIIDLMYGGGAKAKEAAAKARPAMAD